MLQSLVDRVCWLDGWVGRHGRSAALRENRPKTHLDCRVTWLQADTAIDDFMAHPLRNPPGAWRNLSGCAARLTKAI